MEHLAKVRACDLDDERRRPRLVLIGEHPLRVAKSGSAPHSEPAIEPGLLSQPLQRLDAVAPLGEQRIVSAPRFIAATRALDNHSVTAACPEPADRVRTEAV